MSIGSTIKRLRREQNITQEQLAEYLGITSRAISQWECDRTAPDISQIPALCHIFDVSSDVLLGIDIEKSNEAIQNYMEQAYEKQRAGDFGGEAEILREALHKFPRSYSIMQRLANSLVCIYSRAGLRDYEEVFSLCNRILSECTDSITRYEALDTLATAYGYAGKHEEMLKLAKEMPPIHFSYERFMMYRWQGEADLQEFQNYMSFLICDLGQMIGLAVRQRGDNGEFLYPIEDRVRLWETQVSLLELIFPDKDFYVEAQTGEIACSFLCTAYLKKGDLAQAWHWLEKGADFAVHFDTYNFDAKHTSPVLRGHVSGAWIMEAAGNMSQGLLNWLMTDKEAAPLRSDARYNALVERLARVAKKP